MEGYTSDLALFEPPKIEEGVDQFLFIDYLPTTALSPGSVVEFNIPGTGAQYIDFYRSRFNVKAQITQTDGTALVAADKVGPANLTLHSLFKQVDVEVGGKNIMAEVGSHYAYKALLDVLLNRSEDVKETRLQSALYWKDVNDLDALPSGNNSGLNVRMAFFAVSNVCEMEGRLRMDLAEQRKFLLNGVPLTFRFYPSNDNFMLTTAEKTKTYKISVVEAKLRICTLDINPKLILAHNQALSQTDAMYPFWKSNIKSFTIPSGVNSFSAEDIFNGLVPNRCVVVFVRNEAFVGSLTQNPFNFVHENLNYLNFSVNGKTVPGRPLRPDFTRAWTAHEYLNLFWDGVNQSDFINRNEFSAGYSIFCIDVAGSGEGDVFIKQRYGHCRLELAFGSTVSKALTMLVYSRFPGGLSIDKTRNVTLL